MDERRRLQTEQGCAASDRAVKLAEGMGRGDLVAMVRPTQASHWFHRGELAAAHALVDEAWATALELGDPHLGWETVTAPALANNIYLLDPKASEAWSRRALAQPGFDTIARAKEGVTDQLVYALATKGRLGVARDLASQLPEDAVSGRLLLLLEGDWETVERSWAGALDHDLGNGDLLNAGLNVYWLGQVRWLLGRETDALAALARALAICIDGPQIPGELMARAELARLLASHGEVDEAAAHLSRCDEILAAGEDWRGRVGHVELARGAVLAATGGQEAADAAHRKALEVFSHGQLPWWRAETLLAWAGWLEVAGRAEAAEAKRAAASQVYDGLDAHPRWRGQVRAVDR